MNGLTIHIVKSSINASKPLFLLIIPATKSELKNKYKIGDKSDPWEKSAWAKEVIVDVSPLTVIIAFWFL